MVERGQVNLAEVFAQWSPHPTHRSDQVIAKTVRRAAGATFVSAPRDHSLRSLRAHIVSERQIAL